MPGEVGLVERGSSVVTCRTRNCETLVWILPLLPFQCLGIFFIPLTPQSTQLHKEYTVVEMWVFSRLVIAAWLECLLDKPSLCRNELVCQGEKCEALWASNDSNCATTNEDHWKQENEDFLSGIYLSVCKVSSFVSVCKSNVGYSFSGVILQL